MDYGPVKIAMSTATPAVHAATPNQQHATRWVMAKIIRRPEAANMETRSGVHPSFVVSR